MGFTPAGNGATNQPANPAAPTTLNWINALDLSDLNRVLKPDILGDLVSRYGKQSMSDLFVGTFGAKYSLVENHVFSHWEEDFIHGKVVLATTTGGAAGAGVTYNIGTSDVIEVGQTTPPYIGSGTTDYATPYVGATIQFTNGVEAIVTAVAADFTTFTAYPVDITDSLPNVTDGDVVIIKGTTVGEGASKVDSRNSRLIQFENIVGNSRQDALITDIAASSFLWFDVPTDIKTMSGPLRRVWTHKAFADTYQRHCNEIDMTLLDGKRITNTNLTAVAGNETLKKTEGMIHIIESSGNVKDYTIGAMTLDDLDDLILSFRRFKAPNDMYVPCGYNFYKDLNQLVREGDGIDLFAADTPGRLNFGQFNGAKQEVNLDIDIVTRLGYRFAMDPQALFDDPQLLGNVTKYTNMGIFVPVGNAVRYNANDPTTARTVPGMEIVSVPNPKTGQAWMKDEFITGSLFGVPTTSQSVGEYHVRSYFGLRLAGVNRYGIMQGIAS